MNLTKRGCLLCGSICEGPDCDVCDHKTSPCKACVIKAINANDDGFDHRWLMASLAWRRYCQHHLRGQGTPGAPVATEAAWRRALNAADEGRSGEQRGQVSPVRADPTPGALGR